MTVSELPHEILPSDYQPIRFLDSQTFIHVPQAHFGIAEGCVGSISVMRTIAADSVGVGLVGAENAQGVRKIVVGHVDGRRDIFASIKALLNPFGSVPKGLSAFVVTGQYDPDIFEPIVNTLGIVGARVSIAKSGAGRVPLAIDLASGALVDGRSLRGVGEFAPNKSQIPLYAQHVLGDRLNYVPGRGQVPKPMRLAFDLRQGIPKTHHMIAPKTPAVDVKRFGM